MKIFFSKTTNGFYDTELHGNKMPNDVVEISEQTYNFLFEEQYKGKMITSDEEGRPITVNQPVYNPTWEQIKAKRNNLLKESDWIDLPNSPTKNKSKWLEYRQELRDIPQNFKNTEDIVWPTAP